MELDELKLTWQALDRQLERRFMLDFQAFKANRLDRLRASLWPMRIGQIARILFGVALMVLAAPLWAAHRNESGVLFAAGILVHLYGIVSCFVGARLLWMIGALDYAAPVLDIQQRLARLRAFHLRGGFWLGNAWWVLWLPVLLALDVWLEPADLMSALASSYDRLIAFRLGIIAAVSLAFAALAMGLYAWWGREYPDALRRFEDRSSRSIANAREALDDIARFERD